MEESLESIFSSQVEQGKVIGAIYFIRSLDVDFMPTKNMIRAIIFDILMKSDDIRCLALSSDYLITVLNHNPPHTEALRKHYYDSIRSSHCFFENLWDVFSHIVNHKFRIRDICLQNIIKYSLSFLYHRSIYHIEEGENRTEPIKYPNCKFLLEFYVKLFSTDFDYLFIKSFDPGLVMKLLWTSRNYCLSHQTMLVMQWINDIYSNTALNDMADLLESLHEILSLMIRSIMQGKYNLHTELGAFRHPYLNEIVEETMTYCKNASSNPTTVKWFLTYTSFLKYYQARLCEKIIKQIIKQSSKRTYVLTLNDLVNQCMFPQKFNKWKQPRLSNVNKEKNLRKRVHEKKTNAYGSEKKIRTSSSDKKTNVSYSIKKAVHCLGTTKLHEFCKENKFGDLLQALQISAEDINTKDQNGSTPLHEACQAGNYMCVKVLLNESIKASVPDLQFTAANLEGLTPLHIAVKTDSIDIAKALLSAGGPELLSARDKNGYKPIDLSTNGEMEKYLQEKSVVLSNDSDTTAEKTRVREAPNLKSFREYSIYLQALTCLLCSYCDMCNLYDFAWKKTTIVKSHGDKKCCHFLDEDVCSEDAAFISEIPDLVDAFIESIRKNVTKLGIHIEIELIPLEAFAASLRVS